MCSLGESGADVGLNGESITTFAADALREFLGPTLLLKIVEADRKPAPDGQARGGGADAATAAGDDEDLAHGATEYRVQRAEYRE